MSPFGSAMKTRTSPSNEPTEACGGDDQNDPFHAITPKFAPDETPAHNSLFVRTASADTFGSGPGLKIPTVPQFTPFQPARPFADTPPATVKRPPATR